MTGGCFTATCWEVREFRLFLLHFYQNVFFPWFPPPLPPLPTPPLQQLEDRWDTLAVPLAPLLVGNCGQRAPQQMVADEMAGVEYYHLVVDN